MAWEQELEKGVQAFVDEVILPSGCIDASHVAETPLRYVKALAEYTRGVSINPAKFLEKEFAKGGYDEMVIVDDIDIESLCAHHFAPFFGKARFAYIPNGHVVGLSKIPRMIDALAHRPQVQENLTEQIVDIFQATVNPLGCAVSIRAYHMCVALRGINQHGVVTRTNAFRGVFKNSMTKHEFLLSGSNGNERIYP